MEFSYEYKESVLHDKSYYISQSEKVLISGKNLSGGQKQRIALARALIMNPKVLLLDESLCHLDQNTEKAIMEYLWKSFSEMTIITVGHSRCKEIPYDQIIEL